MTTLSRLASAGILAAAAIGFLAISAPAQAIPFSGTLTYGGSTNQSYSPDGSASLMADAATVNEGTDQKLLTLSGTPGAPGMVGQFLIYAQQILDVPAAVSGALGGIQVNWGANARYSFIATSGTYLRDAVNGALNFKWVGTFTDAFGYYNTQVAQFTQGWSQASNGQQPNVGGTMNTNPTMTLAQGVPEPASIAMFGIGLLGLAMVVNRRSSRTSRRDATAVA
jgi:hypothetical protein